jgi:Flp pilus assembly protein TadD
MTPFARGLVHVAFSFFMLVGALAGTGCASTVPLPPRAIQLNQDGASALAAGDLATAEARIALALEYSPRFTEAWVNLGLVELRRGNLDQALRDFKKARDLNPDLPTPHHALGLLADRRGLGREAEAHYRAALKVDPGFAAARANLGRRLFQRGVFDEAREQFARLTEIEPDRMEGWIGLAECFVQLDREGEADDAIAHARERFGDSPEITLLVARQLLRRGVFADAERALAPLTESTDPSRRGAAWSWIAVARAGAASYDAAIAAATQALAIDRDDSIATYAMALSLLAKQDPRAPDWLTRARTLAPRSDAARLLKGL